MRELAGDYIHIREDEALGPLFGFGIDHTAAEKVAIFDLCDLHHFDPAEPD